MKNTKEIADKIVTFLYRKLSERMSKAALTAENAQRFAYGAYKCALLAQIYFGVPTLDKRKVPELFKQNVPSYEAKAMGESIISPYINSVYPHRPPEFLTPPEYVYYVEKTCEFISQTGIVNYTF